MQINCSLQTNQILHDGSALCITAAAVMHIGLSNFLEQEMENHVSEKKLFLQSMSEFARLQVSGNHTLSSACPRQPKLRAQ
jgi:hypothetical protein